MSNSGDIPLFEKRFIGLPGCDECSGSGLVPKEDERGNFGLVRCDCFQRARVMPMVKAAGIPENYQTAQIEGMTRTTDNEYRAYAASLRWIAAYAPKSPGLFLTGPEGTGKTRMLCALAVGLVRKRPIGSAHPIQPFYWTAAELIRDAKETFDNPKAQDPIEVAKTCTVLVLDDLGAEHKTDWGVSVISEIVDARYVNGRTLLAASNLDPVALANRYDSRLAGRIRDMTTILRLDGESRRVEVVA